MTWEVFAGGTEVEVVFVPLGPTRTRVELGHRGWERLSADEVRSVTSAEGGYAAGWTAILSRAEDRRPRLTRPYPTPTTREPERTVDTTFLRTAYADFLAVAEAGAFTDPPPGEWSAAQQLAHIVATDTGIAALALGVASGQRPTYDNRYALDGWNLARLVTRSGAGGGDLALLAELVRERGLLLCETAERLTVDDLATEVHCFILSNDQVMADGGQPLGELIAGIATVHLARHTVQLAALRRSAS